MSKKIVMYGAAAVVLAGAGYWLYKNRAAFAPLPVATPSTLPTILVKPLEIQRSSIAASQPSTRLSSLFKTN